MASNIAIISAATHFAYFRDGDRDQGVSVAGPLGAICVWSDGFVDTSGSPQTEPVHSGENYPEGLKQACADALAYLK